MPKKTLLSSKKTHPQKIQCETHHHQGDGRMSELGQLLLSKLPSVKEEVAGWTPEHTSPCRERHPEVCRTSCGDKCPPNTTFNIDSCSDFFWTPSCDDRSATINVSRNEVRPEAPQKPAPCNEPPVMPVPSSHGRREVFKKPAPCNEPPVMSVPRSKGRREASQKPAPCNEPPVMPVPSNKGCREVFQKPAPCNEPPVTSVPRSKGRREASQKPCDSRPVITISTNEGGVGASRQPACGMLAVHTLHKKKVCPEAPGASHRRPSQPVKNLACNGTPHGTFPKQSCGDRLKKTLSSNKGHPEASQQMLRVDKHQANTISNKAHPGACQTPHSDRSPVHTISQAQCADRHPETTISRNGRCPGVSVAPHCNDKRPVLTLSSNEGRPGGSGVPQCDGKQPVTALSSNERHPDASRTPRLVHIPCSSKECTEDSRTPRSDGRPVQPLCSNEERPEASHKLGVQRPRSSIPSSDGTRGETHHAKEMQTAEASAVPQNEPAATNLTNSGDQSDKKYHFWCVPREFLWIVRYPKFQLDLQKSCMVETWLGGTEQGIFIKGKREDVLACTSYLEIMATQWRQHGLQCAEGGTSIPASRLAVVPE